MKEYDLISTDISEDSRAIRTGSPRRLSASTRRLSRMSADLGRGNETVVEAIIARERLTHSWWAGIAAALGNVHAMPPAVTSGDAECALGIQPGDTGVHEATTRHTAEASRERTHTAAHHWSLSTLDAPVTGWSAGGDLRRTKGGGQYLIRSNLLLEKVLLLTLKRLDLLLEDHLH